MSYTFKLTCFVPASPKAVYDAWLSSEGHSAMTGAAATASTRVNAKYSAWDGYINGENLELVANARIVQSWRTSEFPVDHPNSTITVELAPYGDGTSLTLTEKGGWEDFYFTPMKAYFAAVKYV